MNMPNQKNELLARLSEDDYQQLKPHIKVFDPPQGLVLANTHQGDSQCLLPAFRHHFLRCAIEWG
jgi:hypothetical protein